MKKLSKIKLSEFTELNTDELLHIRGGFTETTGDFGDDWITGDYDDDWSTGDFDFDTSATCTTKMCKRKACKKKACKSNA